MSTDKVQPIDAAWLSGLSRTELLAVLHNYRFFVHRFLQWMGFTFAKCDKEILRQLLLSNLVEECGVLGKEPSHFELLQRCLRTCGISETPTGSLATSTVAVEGWFFGSFRDQDLHTCLCILGPGTENISAQFLEPLETGLRNAFSDAEIDYTYFDVHRPEFEDAHAQALEQALEILEEAEEPFERQRLKRNREFWTNEALAHHRQLWLGLKDYLGVRP